MNEEEGSEWRPGSLKTRGTVQSKSLEPLRFLMFLKEVSSAHQGYIYLIKNTVKNSNIVKYYYNLK